MSVSETEDLNKVCNLDMTEDDFHEMAREHNIFPSFIDTFGESGFTGRVYGKSQTLPPLPESTGYGLSTFLLVPCSVFFPDGVC